MPAVAAAQAGSSMAHLFWHLQVLLQGGWRLLHMEEGVGWTRTVETPP